MNIRYLIAYPLSKLFSNKVNNNLLVFGSTNGNAFSGNSKELFIYLNQYSNYKCFWITSSEKILKDLKKKNYNVISNKKLFQTIKLLKAARYIFITHGFRDILMIDFSPNTKLIHLEHGTSFKKEGYDLKKPYLNFFLKKIVEKQAKSISFTLVTSKVTKRIKMSCVCLPSNKILILGYPRNDILINYTEKLQNDIKEDLDLKNYNEILLYAPTYRDYEIKIPLNEEFFEKLDNFLMSKNKVLLYKPHPFSEKIDLSHYKNIKSVNPNDDIMALLVITNVLITDYSSAFIDYLLTLHPIIFFAYDLEKYLMERGLYYKYESIVPGPIVKTGDELFIKLKNIDQWNKDYEDKRKNIRDLFNKYIDGNSTKRITEYLGLKLNKH